MIRSVIIRSGRKAALYHNFPYGDRGDRRVLLARGAGLAWIRSVFCSPPPGFYPDLRGIYPQPLIYRLSRFLSSVREGVTICSVVISSHRASRSRGSPARPPGLGDPPPGGVPWYKVWYKYGRIHFWRCRCRWPAGLRSRSNTARAEGISPMPSVWRKRSSKQRIAKSPRCA